MRKYGVLACCAFLVLALCGCGPSRGPANEITIWHWMTDRQDALASLARQYELQTGIDVKLSLFAPSDAYTQKVIAAAQAGVLPDIYGILDKRTIVASYIKAGYVMDLTRDFQADGGAWEKSLSVKAVDHNRFVAGNIYQVPPGIYGVPIDVSSIQMVFNRSLLKKAGIMRPPATFVDFLKAVDALRRVGIAPFVAGFGEMWIVDCFVSNYAFNILGEQKIMATFRGEVPYTDPEWVAVFSVFKTLADSKAFIEGIVTKGNKYAEQDFALERAAFSFDGAWAVNVYRSMNPDLDFGVTPLPAMKPETPMSVWGGAGSSFVVNNSSPNKDKAVAFLRWLTAAPQQKYLSVRTNNLPANVAAKAGIAPVLEDFLKAMENATHPNVWALNEDPLVIEALDKGIQSIIIGEKGPGQVAREVQAVKARQMGKRKK